MDKTPQNSRRELHKESRPNRRVLYTTRVIRESFLDLLKEKPLKNINVKEITERADVNRATFYAHYENIDALIAEAEEEMTEHVIGIIDTLYRDPDYKDNMINALFDALLTDKDLIMWIVDDKATGVGRDKIYDYIKEKCFPVWEQARPLTKQQEEAFLLFCYSGTFGLLKQWYETGFRGNEKEMKQEFNEFITCCLQYIYGPEYRYPSKGNSRRI